MSNLEKCIAACQKSLRENEYNARFLKGVKVSHSDVETILFYAQTIQREGTYEGHLMKPRAEVAEVLGKFGLI